MALPTVGWAFLHQVIMKTVPHRCAPKVNTTWEMPQLRLLFMWPEAVSSWQSKPEHISHTKASPDVAKHIPIPSDKEERYLWGCKRWVLVLSWHSLHLFFKFTLGCQPTGWYYPYERRVFSQLNLTGNSLADLGSTMALVVWYPISLTVKSTTTTSRGLVTHTFGGFSSFDSAHPRSPRLALAQWIRAWNKGAWHFVSDLEKYCMAEKFLRCKAPGAVETDGRRTWIP